MATRLDLTPRLVWSAWVTSEHFGNPIIEQRQLIEGKAAVRFDDQAVITVSGEDAKTWLHSLLTQNLKNLTDGASTETLLLDPQGHIEQQIRVIFSKETFYLLVHIDQKDALLTWLRKMIFRSKVTIEDRTPDFEVIGSFSKSFGDLVWIDPWELGSAGGHRYGKPRSFPYRESLIARGAEVDFEPAGTMALEALRIYAGRPKFSDTDEKSLPHEFDWLASAVHLSKGCYRGQETVAKVHNLGHPPRRLVLLHLDSSELLPLKGSEVFFEDRVRGTIRASANHYEAGAVALALISRSVPEDKELKVALDQTTLSASQEVLVPASAGAVAEVPKLPRLKLGSK